MKLTVQRGPLNHSYLLLHVGGSPYNYLTIIIVLMRRTLISLHSTFDSSDVFRNADTVGTIKEHTVWILDSASGKVRGFWGRDM